MSHKNNNKTLTELEEHLRFQSLLAELSASFVRVPPNMVEQVIQESMCLIGESLDLDQISLGLVTPGGQDFYSKFAYVKLGTKPWEASSLMSEVPNST